MTLSMQLQTGESLWDHHSHTRWFGLAALRPLAAVRRWWISGSHFWPDYISITALLSPPSVIIQSTIICSQLSFLWWWHFWIFKLHQDHLESFYNVLFLCGRIVFHSASTMLHCYRTNTVFPVWIKEKVTDDLNDHFLIQSSVCLDRCLPNVFGFASHVKVSAAQFTQYSH